MAGAAALDAGRLVADALCRARLIVGAVLALRGRLALCGAATRELWNAWSENCRAMEIQAPDAPRRGESVVAVVVIDSGRLLPRIGGLTAARAEGKDGLR